MGNEVEPIDIRIGRQVTTITITKNRILEILQLGSRWANYSDHMFEHEQDEVMTLWRTMHVNTCFYDALNRIRKRREGLKDEDC